jgi:hypothetical protein
MTNKTLANNGKTGGMNNLASKWASGRNCDKKIKPVDRLITNYESVTAIHKELLYSV